LSQTWSASRLVTTGRPAAAWWVSNSSLVARSSNRGTSGVYHERDTREQSGRVPPRKSGVNSFGMSSSTTVRIRLRCHVLGWSAAGTGRLELTWCGLLWVGASVRRRASTRTASERTRGSVGIAGETRQAQAAKLRLAPGATHGPRPAPEPGASADGPAGGSGPRRRLPPPERVVWAGGGRARGDPPARRASKPS
jgi:hypothetical protein